MSGKTLKTTGLTKLIELIKSNFIGKSEVVETSYLDIDSTPLSDSENLVSSGGIRNAIDMRATYQTTAPTAAISDGGIHIVYLDEEPTVKYDGYIYMIKEEE